MLLQVALNAALTKDDDPGVPVFGEACGYGAVGVGERAHKRSHYTADLAAGESPFAWSHSGEIRMHAKPRWSGYRSARARREP
jgi:hypothetical protein